MELAEKIVEIPAKLILARQNVQEKCTINLDDNTENFKNSVVKKINIMRIMSKQSKQL